ncbi:LysR family transcriptional regulator [Nitrospirillum amazonense]|uniref:LysR family transcriptional regulator n=1 Tax=Nitrospirillum amazonense TaxID=28077 RepID=UPI002DD425D0|nr:LysR family transcriptional regulator [Nitrospirillum amazonense]MEC4589987.1 LysR family transcriptional regulator [Nitrospirillum amazonense]
MDLNAVAMFVAVIKAQSFSKAATDLGVTKSTISKKISELEAFLGTTLIRRTTRSLQLTQMGAEFYEQCATSLTALRDAAENAQAAGAEPRGHLRVTCPADFVPAIMGPVFAGFMQAYPKITLEVILTDKPLDLVIDNIDVAIRIGNLSDSALMSRRIGREVFQLLASPAYFDHAPQLREPGDLRDHECLIFAPKPELRVWHLQDGERRLRIEPGIKFISNNISMIKTLAVLGAGITLLPVSSCQEEIAAGRLSVLLPELSMGATPIHLVYQKQPFRSPKIQTFVSYVETHVRSQFP